MVSAYIIIHNIPLPSFSRLADGVGLGSVEWCLMVLPLFNCRGRKMLSADCFHKSRTEKPSLEVVVFVSPAGRSYLE